MATIYPRVHATWYGFRDGSFHYLKVVYDIKCWNLMAVLYPRRRACIYLVLHKHRSRWWENCFHLAGGYVGRPLEELVCRTCDLGAVEKRTHFLFEWQGNDAIRNNTLKMGSWILQTLHILKIKVVFFSPEAMNLKKLSNYIITAMMKTAK